MGQCPNLSSDSHPVHTSPATVHRKIRVLTWTLLLIWAGVGFGWVFFARDLGFKIGDWNFNFWMAAQGSVLVFFLITVVNAWLVNRWEAQLPPETQEHPDSAPPPKF